MLMAHPTVLRTLVARYERLRALADRHVGGANGDGGAERRIRQRLQDTVYTLCVCTGTREAGPALAAARAHLARAAALEVAAREHSPAA